MAYNKQLPPPPKYADAPTWRGNSYDVGSRLVRTAWELLFTQDAANISLREVAHAVGVSAPAAYNHFRDRDRLFAELAWGGLRMLTTELLDLIPDELDSMPKGLVPGVCKAWLKFAEDRPRHYALMFSREFNDAERYPNVAESRTNLRQFLRVMSAREIGFEPPAAEADLALALIHGAAALIASGDAKFSTKQVAVAVGRQLAAVKKSR
ncbi:MAG: TetR family transcriptional regulator [Myxococcaceae bacterium]|nr:TetR family transcriptional regulator [Myxococcaceae bacterium]